MSSVFRQLCKSLRLLLAAFLILMLPLVSVPRTNVMQTVAASMDTEMSTNCAAACARTVVPAAPQAILTDEKTRKPDPAPQEFVPYYVQFQAMYVPKLLRPALVYGTSPSRPPDIVKLWGNFRF